jgi:peptide/histidine transporter 3/4
MESGDGEVLRRPGPSAGSTPDARGGWRAAFYLVGSFADLDSVYFITVVQN